MDRLYRVSVVVPGSRAEEARAKLLELFPEGFEEAERDGGVELAVYTGRDGERRLRERFGPVETTAIEAGWAEAWKTFHRPVRVGPLWLGPPWERPHAASVPIVVDPGRAFGTGGHPTTRLCLELLLELPPTSVVDLGCGSGVLAVAAAALGFRPVAALDEDEAAVEATSRNAAANGVALDVRRADALVDPIPATELALANIARDAVEAVARRVPASTLVASGYLTSDRLSLPGWRRLERREADGWAGDLLARAEPPKAPL